MRNKQLAAERPAAFEGRRVWPVFSSDIDAQAMALQFQFWETERWEPKRLLSHQLYQLKNIIDHAARNVPFYKEWLAPFAKIPPDAFTLHRFREIPPLAREEVRDAGTRFHACELPPGHGPTYPIQTSGSTSKPLEALGTRLTAIMSGALTLRGHVWHGRDLTGKNISIRRLPDNYSAEVQHRWAAVPHTGPHAIIDHNLPSSEILEKLITEDPNYLEGHPSMVLGLAQSSADSGRRMPNLREVRTFGEALDPWVCQFVKRVWGVPVIDNYGAEEFTTIAHQCPETSNLHVMSENVFVEVVDEQNRPCRIGDSGRILVTSLINYATPLIRYELGDIVELGDWCSCGRSLPVLKRIRGRAKDLLLLPGGDTLFPSIYEEILGVEKIKQHQLIQTSLHEVVIKLVLRAPLDEDERQSLLRDLKERLVNKFEIKLEYVDEIPREPSGKYQVFKSLLTETVAA